MAKFQNTATPRFQPNVVMNMITKGAMQVIAYFLAIGQVKKKTWHFEVLTYGALNATPDLALSDLRQSLCDWLP